MSSYMLGHTLRYRTLAPMIVVRTRAGAEKYISGKGRLLPLDASPAHVEQLLEVGLVEEVER